MSTFFEFTRRDGALLLVNLDHIIVLEEIGPDVSRILGVDPLGEVAVKGSYATLVRAIAAKIMQATKDVERGQ